MAKQDCIPKKDADFLIQLKFLSIKAPTQQMALNLSPGDLVALAADATLFETKLNAFNDADAAYRQASADKQNTRAEVEGRVRAIIRRMKSSAGYTEAIGQALKIIGADDTTDLSTAKPDLSANPLAHGIELSFTKSKSDGVNIYGKRDGEVDFVFLAHDTAAPYVDNRPLLVAGKPEVRRYKAVYILNDAEIGQFSDEIVATAYP